MFAQAHMASAFLQTRDRIKACYYVVLMMYFLVFTFILLSYVFREK